MLKKVNVYICLLLLIAGYVSTTVPTELCSECEEEIWEEVPCDQVIPNSTTTTTERTTTTTNAPTTTTTPIPTTTTTTTPPPPPTAPPATQPPQTPPAYNTPAPSLYYATTTPSSGQYKNCYCECKIGCKEFCRKVLANTDPRKHITQTSKTLQHIYPGRVEIKHVHERVFVPGEYIDGSYRKPAVDPVVYEPITTPKPVTPVYPIENSAEIDPIYDTPKPAVNSVSVATAAGYPSRQQSNYYQRNAVPNTPVYSLQDLTKLLAAPVGYNSQPYAYYSQNQKQQDYNQQTYGSQGTPPVPTYASPQYTQQQNQYQEANAGYYNSAQAQPSSNVLPANSAQPPNYAQQYSQVPGQNVASYSNGPGQTSTAAAAAVASSAISDSSNSNYQLNQNRQLINDNSNLQYPQESSYSNPALNENKPPLNFNLDGYLKDYVYSHQTSVNAYPDYQLSYPSY